MAKLKGTSANDEITGTTSADKIYGYDGDDRLFGGDGNDSVYGGVGNDLILGEAGNDKLYGQAGDDHLYGGAGNDYLDGGVDNDYLSGGEGNDILLGGNGNDNLNGDEGDDQLDGGVGDDELIGYHGNDKLVGGVGNDTIYGGVGDDTIDGGSGNDRLFGEDKYAYSGDGSDGNDTFLFGKGSGQDEIWGFHVRNRDVDHEVGFFAGDKVIFGKGIKADQVKLNITVTHYQAEDDEVGIDIPHFNLELSINGNDKLTINDYLTHDVNNRGIINFIDGTQWTYAQVKAMVAADVDTIAFDNFVPGLVGTNSATSVDLFGA